MLSLLIRKAVLERKERGPDAADASGCWQREPHFYLPVLLRGLWGAVRRRGNLEFSVPLPHQGGCSGTEELLPNQGESLSFPERPSLISPSLSCSPAKSECFKGSRFTRHLDLKGNIPPNRCFKESRCSRIISGPNSSIHCNQGNRKLGLVAW